MHFFRLNFSLTLKSALNGKRITIKIQAELQSYTEIQPEKAMFLRHLLSLRHDCFGPVVDRADDTVEVLLVQKVRRCDLGSFLEIDVAIEK